jgi:methionine-rich copper-binding protein CopC
MSTSSRILTILALIIPLISVSGATAFADNSLHDSHAKGEMTVTAKITGIVYFENGMSLMLDREISPKESCVHIENAASFSTRKLEKIEAAKKSNQTLTMKIADGHVVDVVL